MNVEFKNHQLVVAGMQEQIKLLTLRCIEWQQKLAESKSETNRVRMGLDRACACLASVQILTEGGDIPADDTEGDTPSARLVQKVHNIVTAHDEMADEVDRLQSALASATEQHAAEIREIKSKARKAARRRSRK